MTVTVAPRQFRYVFFDADTIERAVAHVLALVDMADRDVHIEIDEASPVVQMRTVEVSHAVIALRADSGAFEDTRRLRHFSADVTATTTGRVLLRIRDREDPGFADAPDDDALTRAQSSAWDTWSMSRLARLGLTVHQPRWRYSYRNRHGFTDAADRAFDQIWTAESFTWAELAAVSAAALPIA